VSGTVGISVIHGREDVNPSHPPAALAALVGSRAVPFRRKGSPWVTGHVRSGHHEKLGMVSKKDDITVHLVFTRG
jgi:hypothetical protein